MMNKNKMACCLWIDGAPQETADFYLDIFDKSEQKRSLRFVEDIHGRPGEIATIELNLAGSEFILLNGGPEFTPTPAISYVINCEDNTQLENVWQRLSADGTVLMEFQEYPEIGLFGWVEDRYGFSWQVKIGEGAQSITPCIMFANERYEKAQEAVTEWLTIFGGGTDFRLLNDDQTTQLTGFHLYDQSFLTMDSPEEHKFGFSMANSFYIYCEDQDEIDRLWESVTNEGTEYPCGWMMDKFGISWQTVPRDLSDLLDDHHFEKAYQTTLALYKMKKIDIEKLRSVHRNA